MAAYNAEKYIAEQLNSVLAQTSHAWTLYIRNDGSTDSTQQIINLYTAQYPDKIIQLDKGGGNLGCNGNFYRLLEVVEADYYMFCDADDVWLEGKTSILFEEIKRQEDIYPNIPILVHGDTIVCDENLTVIYPSLWNRLNLKPNRITKFHQILVRPVIGGSTSVFNKISKKYIFPIPSDNRILYDHWIGLCIAKYGKIKSLNKVLKYYRQHDNQVCGLDVVTTSKYSYKQLKEKIKHIRRDAVLFKSIGVPQWRFYTYKLYAYVQSKFIDI